MATEPRKPAPKQEKKRSSIKDLPVKTRNTKSAEKVKGGLKGVSPCDRAKR